MFLEVTLLIVEPHADALNFKLKNVMFCLFAKYFI